MADDRPYKVGYGRPPVEHQFPKGTSGFKGYRHQPRPSMSDQLDRILREKVKVSDGGRVQKLTKEEIFLRQLVSRAIAGDRPIMKLLLGYLEQRPEQGDPGLENATDAFLIAELRAMFSDEEGDGDGD